MATVTMHYWCFLIPVLAVIGAVASFSGRPLIDVHQQCFDRRDRDSPLSRPYSAVSERPIITNIAAASLIKSRERENQRCHADRVRELAENRRSYIVRHREERSEDRKLDSPFSHDGRHNSERSIRNSHNSARNGKDSFRSSARQFDSRRTTSDLYSENDIKTIPLSRSTLSVERILLRTSGEEESKQRRTRSVSEFSGRLLNSRFAVDEPRFSENRAAVRSEKTNLLSRGTRGTTRNREERTRLSSRLFESRLTLDERRESQERRSENSATLLSHHTYRVERLHSRAHRDENRQPRIRLVRNNAFERSARTDIPSGNSEDRSESRHLLDSRSRERYLERSERTTAFSRGARNIENRPITSHTLEARLSLDGRKEFRARGFVKAARTVQLSDNRQRLQSRTNADNEINMQRMQSMHGMGRLQPRSLNDAEFITSRDRNIQSTRTDNERNMFDRVSDSRIRSSTTQTLRDNTNDIRDIRARNEPTKEQRQENISREHQTERLVTDRERKQVDPERRFVTRDRVDSQSRRTETQRLEINSPIMKISSRREEERRNIGVIKHSRFENRAGTQNKPTRNSSPSQRNRELNTAEVSPNARVRASQRIERVRDTDLTRTLMGQREVLQRVLLRDRRTRTVNKIDFSTRNSQIQRKREALQTSDLLKQMSRRQSAEIDTRFERINEAFKTMSQKSKTAERNLPNLSYRRETTKNDRILLTRGDEVSSRTTQTASENDSLFTIEWKTIAFHALQGIYMYAVVFQIIGGIGKGKGNKTKLNEWMSSSRNSVKVD